MAKVTKRYAIVFLLILLSTIATKNLQGDYSPTNNSDFQISETIPMQINNIWKGQDFPLDESIFDILETRAIIHRLFTNRSGESVFLSVVYYKDTRINFHSPEDCFIGQGLKPEKSYNTINIQADDSPKSIKVVKLISTNTHGKAVNYHFFKAGNFTGRSFVKMRLNIAANKLLNNDPRAALIRVSTNLKPGSEEPAELLLSQFLQDLFPYINKSL